MSTHTDECVECHGKRTVPCKRCMGTGKEIKSDFQIISITNWDKIISCKRDFEGKSWIFRGQPDSELPLETLLDRHCKSFLDDFKEAPEREKLLLREFQRRFHQYTNDMPDERDILEWFSILQHYGAPTRLLDFSYSISIAAFFALEKAKKDEAYLNCSIWAINAEWAQDLSARMFEGTPEYCYFSSPIKKENGPIFEKVFMRDTPYRFICPVNPFRLNERLTIQKGIFMCPGDITRTFEENLKLMNGHDSDRNVIKLVIRLEKREWRKALDSLYDQNITRAVLFPGLDGFATSLIVSPPKLLLRPNKTES